MRRLAGLCAAVLAVAVGLAVHLSAPDGAASDIAADALYVIAVWGGLVLLFPGWRSWMTAAVVLGWSVAVELFQLTGLPLRWAGEWPPIVLVFGTVFDPRDLVVYAVTAAAVGGVDAGTRRAIDRRGVSAAA
ncbi:DUF2809 domain-containing protein [Microbacterium oleivorans]|uniref:ribosomal maturation YjgA family protein n=1 Tax=Microbacterium oleivorans TaxID=273677 RepID=UPI002040E916|nr:DUF2809 domain-containing protein [Microbacterium oleivorans]MCM3696352.1 DUF2809 domain-containing protein [Microbacterium oleivorans]